MKNTVSNRIPRSAFASKEERMLLFLSQMPDICGDIRYSCRRGNKLFFRAEAGQDIIVFLQPMQGPPKFKRGQLVRTTNKTLPAP